MKNEYIQTVRVDFDQVLCDDFLGLNAVYHGFSWMPENLARGVSDADRAAEFAAVREARLRVGRTMFIPAYNCERIEGPYNMLQPEMQAIRKWCEAMRDNGVDVALQAGWHYSRNTYHGHDAPDAERDPERFAEWAVQSFSYLMNDCGLTNIKYLFLFTEPTSYASGETPEGYTIWSYYVKVCKAIDRRFREAGLRDRLKFVGPNNTSGGTHLAEAVRDLNDVIDIYSSHDYNFVHQQAWADMAKRMADVVAPTGKPFWMDEYGVQLEIFRATPEYGSFLAQIITASMAAGHQTTLIWTLLDQLHTGGHYNRDSFHDGVHRWGVYTWPRDTIEGAGAPYPAWYAYVLLSKAMGGRLDGGKVRSCATENALTLYTAAVKQDEEYTVLVVNSDAEAEKVEIRLSQPLDRPVYRHVFAPCSATPGYETLSAPTRVACDGGRIVDTLPKSGFAVYSTREAL